VSKSCNPPGNPQGKGTSGVLATLDGHRHGLAAMPAKPVNQVATELFTALFVLEARFRFKPVPDTRYYLYQPHEQAERHRVGDLQLCLTPPSMMSEAVGGRYIACCILHRDMTWSVELADAVAADPGFMAWLADKRHVFEQRLEQADTLDDVLPHYERQFSFHRRAAAFGVAFSLGRSMAQSGIRHMSYDQARGLLAHDDGPTR